MATQRLSRRRSGATNFRAVQGALNADGLGNLLSAAPSDEEGLVYLLRYHAAEVRHQQYGGYDVVTVSAAANGLTPG